MRYLTVIVLFMLLANFTLLSGQGALGEESENKSEFSIVGKNEGNKPEDFHFKIGENLQIKASGELAKNVETEWSKTRLLTLYFDGERIADLKSPPIQVESGKELLLNFALVRNAEDDSNRQAWDRLFIKKHEYLMSIQPSLAIGNNLPLVVQSAQPFQFYVASGLAIGLSLVVGLVTLVTAYWYLVKKTKMLCDADTNYYSLGKSQMAFWGLLVVLSFTGVWILTGKMERIPPQALILLGISGTSGLSAVVIGNSKKGEIQTKLTELRQEEKKLQDQQISAQAAFSQASEDRLAVIKQEIDKLYKQLEVGKSKGFWRDICDDGNGASFHRLQVVIWTMVLGIVFVQNVAQVMSMPEFPETLLTLLGISNATYLGFKIPEKP